MRWSEDTYVDATFQAKTLVPSAGCLLDAHVNAGAAIGTAKMRHKHLRGYGQPNAAATTETRGLRIILGATGTVVAFKAGSIAPCAGNATVTLDLKKNGASILTAVIQLDLTNTARIAEAATIATAALAVGDWLEVVIVATIGTGTLATGVYCELEIDEDAV